MRNNFAELKKNTKMAKLVSTKFLFSEEERLEKLCEIFLENDQEEIILAIAFYLFFSGLGLHFKFPF